MKCPVDNETLVMTDRNGVEIDYCPKCRSVWLDRGELDKIIERTAAPQAPAKGRRHYDDDDHDDWGERGEGGERGERGFGGFGGRPRKKRDSFLGELFDF